MRRVPYECVTLAWSAVAGPSAAQELVQLPGEDRWLEADFADVYPVGALTGADWEQFGDVQTVGDPRTAIVGKLFAQPGQDALISQATFGTEGTGVLRRSSSGTNSV